MNQIDRLLTIMQRLRDPENGCPWDKEQTFATIAPYTLEETYEVLDAIQREDFDDLRGELGDLLFAAVKVGRFLGLDSELALHAACEKFIRRFRRTEELAGQPMTQMELSDLERFWAQAKRDSDSTSMT